MPGIDRNRVIEKTAEELDEFTCGICHEVLVNPMSTPCCQQTYCKNCITEWLTTDNTCPNDRKRLTSDGLLQSNRIVVNLIDKMQIRCVFSEKGCPSVHTITQDSKHLDVCPFARCGQCGLEDPEPNHNCVTHLLNVNLNLNEDIEQLKAWNKDLREECQKLKTDLNVKSKEWSQRESQLKAKAIQLERELALVKAICEANSGQCLVNENFHFGPKGAIGGEEDWKSEPTVGRKGGPGETGRQLVRIGATNFVSKKEQVPVRGPYHIRAHYGNNSCLVLYHPTMKKSEWCEKIRSALNIPPAVMNQCAIARFSVGYDINCGGNTCQSFAGGRANEFVVIPADMMAEEGGYHPIWIELPTIQEGPPDVRRKSGFRSAD